MDLRDRTVFVTGASRGIGAAVAQAVATKGARVGLVARTQHDLDDIVRRLGDRAASATADVGDLAALTAAFTELERVIGPPDVLVANAGIGAYGPFVDIDTDELERVVAVNVLGTMYAIRAVLPGMISRRRGHIVTIGSIAGRIGSPFEAVYSATKFASVGLTEALATEVEPYGIGVSIVNPGPVSSNFGEARGHPYDRDRPKPVSSVHVAKVVVAAIEHDRAEVYVPGMFRPAVIVRHLLPRLLRWGSRRSFRDELAADAATR